MSLHRGRVLSSNHAQAATPIGGTALPEQGKRARVLSRADVEASLQAQQTLAQAKALASQIVAQAQAQRETLCSSWRQQAQEQARAELAAQWLTARNREATADLASLERTIGIATIMTERLVARAIDTDPQALVGLAREAVSQFWMADRITIRGHELDVVALSQHLDALGVRREVVTFERDNSMQRGDLLVVSSHGTVDARLPIRLERLAETVRRSLQTA